MKMLRQKLYWCCICCAFACTHANRRDELRIFFNRSALALTMVWIGATVTAVVAAAAIANAGSAVAAPLLRCQIEQGGSTQVLEFAPVGDPYGVAAIDIRGRFRFKAVVIGDAQHVEYIKLYTYTQRRRQPVLLHMAHYTAPKVEQGASYAALTGIHYVYSPELERELRYGCALVEGKR